MKALILAAGLILGGALTHMWEAAEIAGLHAEIATVKSEHSEKQAQDSAAALTRLQAANARADKLQGELDDTEQRLSTTEKDIQFEIARNTTGRACLNRRTVGMLNRAAAEQPAALPAPAVEPVAEDGAVATDTDVATWANVAIKQYNTCRARLGALINWFPPTSTNDEQEQDHD